MLSRFSNLQLRLAALGIMALLALVVAIAGTFHPTPAEAGSGTPQIKTFLMPNVSAPDTVPAGHQPITVTVSVKNVTGWDMGFAGTIFVGGPAWGRENYPYTFSPGTEVYWTEGGANYAPDGTNYYWFGKIKPNQTATFTLPTFSGQTTGRFPFVKADFQLPGSGRVLVERGITVTASKPNPTPTPTATPTPTSAPNATGTATSTPTASCSTPSATRTATATPIATPAPYLNQARYSYGRIYLDGSNLNPSTDRAYVRYSDVTNTYLFGTVVVRDQSGVVWENEIINFAAPSWLTASKRTIDLTVYYDRGGKLSSTRSVRLTLN